MILEVRFRHAGLNVRFWKCGFEKPIRYQDQAIRRIDRTVVTVGKEYNEHRTELFVESLCRLVIQHDEARPPNMRWRDHRRARGIGLNAAELFLQEARTQKGAVQTNDGPR